MVTMVAVERRTDVPRVSAAACPQALCLRGFVNDSLAPWRSKGEAVPVIGALQGLVR